MSMPAIAPQLAPDQELERDIAAFYDDPEGFVMFCYPWGKKGTILEQQEGPDQWQLDALCEVARQVREHKFDGVHPVPPIRIAVPSGHGTGKGAFLAWIVDWVMSTRPGSRGSITANTAQQLQRKTWSTILTWTKLCITAHWFETTSELMWFKGRKEDWYMAAVTCAPENAEAFQGQHARRGQMLILEPWMIDRQKRLIAFGKRTKKGKTIIALLTKAAEAAIDSVGPAPQKWGKLGGPTFPVFFQASGFHDAAQCDDSIGTAQ